MKSNFISFYGIEVREYKDGGYKLPKWVNQSNKDMFEQFVKVFTSDNIDERGKIFIEETIDNHAEYQLSKPITALPTDSAFSTREFSVLRKSILDLLSKTGGKLKKYTSKRKYK
jgi:hypothetical protein